MENILKHRLAVQQNIEKGFNDGTNLNEELEKARSGVYEDTAKNRKLNRVGQQYGGKKQEDEPKGEGSRKEKQDVSSYAKNASEGALKRAAADEKASEDVRNAAKKELEKRGKNGDDKKWKSVFDKMKKVDGNFTEEMYDDLAELAQKHGVDYYGEGIESLKKLPIKEVEKIVNDYSNGGSEDKGDNKESESKSGYKMNKYIDKNGDERYQVINPEGHISYDGYKKGAEKTMKRMEKWVEKQKKEKENKKVEDSFTEKEWGEVNDVMDSIKNHYPNIDFKKFNKRDSIAASKTSMGNWRIYVKDEGDWLGVATIGKKWLSEDVAKKMGWIENFENN